MGIDDALLERQLRNPGMSKEQIYPDKVRQTDCQRRGIEENGWRSVA
jgi:hypothetical protein